MKQLTLALLCSTLILTSSQCNNDYPPPNGHLELTITYPEAVLENGVISWMQIPGDGAEVRLYDKDAQCLGYRDAKLDVAWIEDKAVASKYVQISNETGGVLFKDIPSGEYYLVVFTRHLSKYTEKYIEVNGGDTLKLAKNFTPDLTYWEDLEPWDYEMPGY